MPKEQTRFMRAEARADGYHCICPYKVCGHLITLDGAKKDEIIRCPNCNKDFKISKIVLT